MRGSAGRLAMGLWGVCAVLSLAERNQANRLLDRAR